MDDHPHRQWQRDAGFLEERLRLVEVELVERHRLVVADLARHELVGIEHAEARAERLRDRLAVDGVLNRLPQLEVVPLNGGLSELKKNCRLVPAYGASR